MNFRNINIFVHQLFWSSCILTNECCLCDDCLLDMATVCRYFRTARGCWYGDQCRFVHDRTCRFFKYAVTEML